MTDPLLTAIERHTLELLLAGKRQVEIAEIRGVNHQSVGTVLRNALRKTGLRTLVQLGAWAERHGIREHGAQL